MFIFGTNDFGDPRCENDGKQCKCFCEDSANDFLATCDTTDQKGYCLYKYSKPSKFLFQKYFIVQVLY